MHQSLLCFCLLLLGPEIEGHLLPPTTLPGGAAGTLKLPGLEVSPFSSSQRAGARALLGSLPLQLPQLGLPTRGVSCPDLLPPALDGFSELPPLPWSLASAALALSLQGAGCPHQAEELVLQLYGAVGMDDANALLLGVAGLPRAPKQGGRGRAALIFNVDQLAGVDPQRCSGLARLDSLLLGPVASTHATFPAAAAACRRLGAACAGVASDGTTAFSVIDRHGAYSLPGRGAQAWLHRCSRAGRNRRGTVAACSNAQEQKVHGVLEWVPLVSTYYNVGTSMYYAFQNCTELARERGLEAAMDLGYDALLGLTSAAGSPVVLGAALGLKPAFKVGMRSLISYFRQAAPAEPLPTSSSGPIRIATSFPLLMRQA